MTDALQFNPPPGWPKAPPSWKPPAGWTPPPDWPAAPPGWQLWVVPQGAEPTSTAGPETPPVQTVPSPDSDPRQGRIEVLEKENAQLRQALLARTTDDSLIPLDDSAVLQAVGIYRYHHPLESAAAYVPRLELIEQRIATLIRSDEAIEKSNMFTFNNSLAQGRKMTADLSALMLRAYNAEADNCLRTLRAGNVETAKRRLERARDSIAKLGRMMEMQIGASFHALRVEEIELTADWLFKKQEERELARDERARLREEKRVERELAAERERLDKERALLLQTLESVRRSGADDRDLAARLEVIDQAIADNDFRAANIRAGHVYVISNKGAFGEGVVKIGLTRRLDPLERVHELGGASVPFRFDVHTIYFSEDAVTLETELHRHFADRALNQANPRKEFFFATPEEVREVLESKVGNLLEFTSEAQATEFNQSRGQWPNGGR
jgi:hypothetical protein